MTITIEELDQLRSEAFPTGVQGATPDVLNRMLAQPEAARRIADLPDDPGAYEDDAAHVLSITLKLWLERLR